MQCVAWMGAVINIRKVIKF